MTCSHIHFHQQSIQYFTQIWKKITTMMFKVSNLHTLWELTHSHLGLLTRHLGHLKPPRTFLTRHLFIDGHLLPSGNKHWRNDTHISVVGKSGLKLMNYVFYLTLKSPNSCYENPERILIAIMMQPISICTITVNKISLLKVANQMIYAEYALLYYNKPILYGKHKLFQQK